MTARVWILSVWVLTQVVIGHRDVQVWHSPLTLWTRAAALAPLRWRPALNLEKAQAVEDHP